MSDVFSGFPLKGLQFLADLTENNDREWFNANKEMYKEYILAPAVAFIETLGDRLRFIAPHIQYDTRTNGQGSLMRLYRDIRFSADKSPYKTWVGIRFWEGAGKKTECPGFFLWFEAGQGGLFAGMYGFPPAMLKAYRQAVVDEELGDELEKAIDTVTAAGAYDIGGDHYKKVPRGFDPDHPRANLLKHNALYASPPRFSPEELSSPGLVEQCAAHCEKMAPLHRWMVKVHAKLAG